MPVAALAGGVPRRGVRAELPADRRWRRGRPDRRALEWGCRGSVISLNTLLIVALAAAAR